MPLDDQGVGAHKDSGFLTLLLQDKQRGLQVETDDGCWIDAEPLPGTFIVNVAGARSSRSFALTRRFGVLLRS